VKITLYFSLPPAAFSSSLCLRRFWRSQHPAASAVPVSLLPAGLDIMPEQHLAYLHRSP
jgi:hypothetical protein